MSALALVPSDRPAVGDRVHVPDRVWMECGRSIPRGHYDVERVEATPPEHAHLGAYRVVVTARPDCSALPKRFRMPSPDERRAGAPVPLCAQPSRFFLYPGSFTAYADGGDGPLTIHDR